MNSQSEGLVIEVRVLTSRMRRSSLHKWLVLSLKIIGFKEESGQEVFAVIQYGSIAITIWRASNIFSGFGNVRVYQTTVLQKWQFVKRTRPEIRVGAWTENLGTRLRMMLQRDENVHQSRMSRCLILWNVFPIAFSMRPSLLLDQFIHELERRDEFDCTTFIWSQQIQKCQKSSCWYSDSFFHSIKYVFHFSQSVRM
jgi:hypothetical protein